MNPQTLMNQIGSGNLMGCGARDFVTGENELSFRVGSSRKLSKIIISLDYSDTYVVRYVEMKNKTYEVVKDEVRTDVHVEEIGRVVREMGDG
jgi:hypothetical protein